MSAARCAIAGGRASPFFQYNIFLLSFALFQTPSLSLFGSSMYWEISLISISISLEMFENGTKEEKKYKQNLDTVRFLLFSPVQ